MSVYAKLAGALAERREDVWKVRFEEIERLLGRNLPASARKFPAWWSNDPSNNSMTKVWLYAGWRTEQVDVPGQTVVFRRAEPAKLERKAMGLGETDRPYEVKSRQQSPDGGKQMMEDQKGAASLDRLYGCLKGMARVADGDDLCAPSDEEWEVLKD